MKKRKINKKGFTLIELLAVIIILGVLLIISVPAVSKYIESSRIKTYKNNLVRYIDAVRTEVNSSKNDEYKFASDQYLAVPLACIQLEKGSTTKSPFSEYNTQNSFILVVRNNGKYEYYISAQDTSGYGTKVATEKDIEVKKLNAKEAGSLYLGRADLGSETDTILGEKTLKLVCSKGVIEEETEEVPGEEPSGPSTVVKPLSTAILENNASEHENCIDASGNAGICPDNVSSTYVVPTEGVDGINFKAVSSDTNGKGLYKTSANTEDENEVYYFRGAVDNNYVQFGKDADNNNLYWRIVRINEDGSIRMVYHGTSILGGSGNIGDSYYNVTIGDDGSVTSLMENMVLGYMYDSSKNVFDINDDINDEHGNVTSSTVKNTIDAWYVSTNLDELSGDYLADAGFCNDRVVWNNSYSTYAGYKRLRTDGKPIFKCNNASTDLFTMSSSTKGNKALINPIGLLTGDEVVYAGVTYATASADSYLNTGETYWTMTPYNSTRIWTVGFDTATSASKLSATQIAGTSVKAYKVRPVINLKADVNVEISGNGTTATPYVVQ